MTQISIRQVTIIPVCWLATIGCHPSRSVQSRPVDHDQVVKSFAPTCSLSDAALAGRRTEIDQLFTDCTEVRELTDGYAFKFPSTDNQTRRLIDFVDAERRCCGFMTFELAFEPDDGPLWLRLRGSAEVKQFVAEGLRKRGLFAGAAGPRSETARP